jgi:hypothetical protein
MLADAELNKICATNGWKCVDDIMSVTNQEATLKSRHIDKKLDFDREHSSSVGYDLICCRLATSPAPRPDRR